MNRAFRLVVDGLEWLAAVMGLTYTEINIIAYYTIIPFAYIVLLDHIGKRHRLKAAYVAAWAVLILAIPDFRAFSDALFQYSMDFLLLFGHVGLDYVAASVVICVVLPALVFLALCLWAFPSWRPQWFAKVFLRQRSTSS